MRVDDPTEGFAADNPEAVTLDRMSAVEAAQLIARHLSPEQCDVILMRILGDLEVTQVAAAMGQSETWVRVTQHRALRRLARRLGTHIELAPGTSPTTTANRTWRSSVGTQTRCTVCYAASSHRRRRRRRSSTSQGWFNEFANSRSPRSSSGPPLSSPPCRREFGRRSSEPPARCGNAVAAVI